MYSNRQTTTGTNGNRITEPPYSQQTEALLYEIWKRLAAITTTGGGGGTTIKDAASITALQATTGATGQYCITPFGCFEYSNTGTVDGYNVFAASGGGFWVLISRGELFIKEVHANAYAGIDPTGTTECSAAIQALINRVGAVRVVFDGSYRVNAQLTPQIGQTLYFKAGTEFVMYQNTAPGTSGIFNMATGSQLLFEAGCVLRHQPNGANAYRGIIAQSTAYNWAITGRVEITNFGNEGITVSASGAGSNQMVTGYIHGVLLRNNIDNGFGGGQPAGGNGHGLRVLSGGEYIQIENVQAYQNGGAGIVIEGANNIVNNCRISRNAREGLYIIGNVGNSDHFHVTGCQINHQDTTPIGRVSVNVRVKDVDTGVNFSGCSMYGGVPFRIDNSKGVSFTGCGMSATGSGVYPAMNGAFNTNINGGHIISGTQAQVLANYEHTGAGVLVFNNVLDS